MRAGSIRKILLPMIITLALAGCWKSSEERAAEHYQNGLALVEEGDTDRALVEFRNTLKLSQNNIDARRQMARIFLDRDNMRAAYRDYLHVVEQAPEDFEGRTMLSEIAFVARDWDEFERHSEVAIRLNPEDPTVLALIAARDYREAALNDDSAKRKAVLAQAETLAEDQPDSDILRNILIDGYINQEKFDAALEQLEKAIEANPEEQRAYGMRIELLSRMGRNAEIEGELRRMVDRFPEDEEVTRTYLRYLMSRGKQQEAETFLRDSVTAAPDDETRRNQFGALVQFLLVTEGAEAALAELDAALAEDPAQDTLRALRASIKFDTGQRSEGIAEMQAILNAEEPNLTSVEAQNIRVALAQMLLRDGNEVGARKLVEEILEADPNSVGALKMQAGWLIREDQTDAAINGLRAALDQAPEDVEAMTLMAQAYQRAGNTPLMLEFLSLAVDASNNAPAQSLRYADALLADDKALEAESILINSLRITPGNVDVLTALGRIYLALDDRPRARQVVDTLRQIETEAAQNNANALNVELLARTSGAEEALGYLENLAGESGASGQQAKLALLRARLRSGEIENALDYAKGLVEEEPDNLQYRNALALTYASARDFDAAKAEFNALLEANPKLVQPWVQLARIHIATDDRDTALATIDNGLEAIPDAPDLLWAKASFLQQDGDIDGAIEIYENLYERFSESPVIANNLASLLGTFRADDPAAIERAQVIARRLKDAEIPAFQDTYGWLQHLAGDHETAVTYLEPAAAGLSQDPQVQLHLGLVYAALDRRDDAVEQLRKAISLSGPLGSQELVARAEAKIAEIEAGSEQGSDQN